MNKLIGLYSSAPRCGKSTVAKHLRDEHNYTIVPFAKTLKSMLVPFLGGLGYSELEIARLIDHDKHTVIPEVGVTVRHLLQTLGTEWGKCLVADDVWLRVWHHSAKRYERVVVDDVRFPNEAELIKAQGGELWLIERPNIAAPAFALPDGGEGVGCHASDGALAGWPFDRTLVNDGTIHRLLSQVHPPSVPPHNA